jgi:hypothetical protein
MTYLALGEVATPPALEAGDRRFDPCQPDLRGGGVGVLASLMSSRSRVRIPSALPRRRRSSATWSARLSGERSPVRSRSSPLWPWCSGEAFGAVIPAAPVRVRPVTPHSINRLRGVQRQARAPCKAEVRVRLLPEALLQRASRAGANPVTAQLRGPEHRRLSVRAPRACAGRSARSSRARSQRSVAQFFRHAQTTTAVTQPNQST